jgi:hypothetical protein
MAAVDMSTVTVRQNTYASRKPIADALDDGRPRFKVGYITVPATADNGDTVTLDFYNEFKILKPLAVVGFIHTTANSVIVEEAPTTAYDGTSIVLTVGGATPNKPRFYAIYGV